MNYATNANHSMISSQSPTSAPQASPVEEALSRLESQAAQLRDIVGRMSTRLNPVLIPSGTGGESSQAPGPCPLPAPLVSKIDGLTEFLSHSYADLLEMERRLAL